MKRQISGPLSVSAQRRCPHLRRCAFAFATLLALLPAVAHGDPPAPEDFAGHWEGELQLPGVKMPFLVDFKLENGRWSGTMDIPMEGTQGMALSSIWVESPVIHFAIPDVPGDPVFEGTLDGTRITGALRQGGQEVRFHLSRDKVEGPLRPQEPRPPFPYPSVEVTYQNGGITLAGTLTVPPGKGPFPAVLLCTGSGPQDRNEAVFGHKPFLVLADALTRGGIAVLRVDDRGVGGSTGKTSESTTSDFADDALAGVRFLRGRDEIDKKRIGIIGHSEGALVGPLAASRSKDVRFVVLLAGTGVPGADVVTLQMEEMARGRGMPEEAVRAQTELLRVAFAQVTAGADSAAVRDAIDTNGARLREAAPDSLDDDFDMIQNGVDQFVRGLESPWFRYFLPYDPRPALRQVKVPVLVLNGELDLQVRPDQNLPEIEKALAEAGNKDVTVKRLPKLNHLFQPATTGLPEEYMAIPITMDPSVLDLIRNWIVERFGRS